MLPDYERYIEPFFGGGAVYFALEPARAAINDISGNLMDFYKLVKTGDREFKYYLEEYCNLWEKYKAEVLEIIEDISLIYINYRLNKIDDDKIIEYITRYIKKLLQSNNIRDYGNIIIDFSELENEISRMVINKVKRTKANEQKLKKELCAEDLKENLLTGFTSGLYMHFRNIYNRIQLKLIKGVNKQYRVSNFYFIREFCYGSMFRYNSKGEFNIPYGGISYNRKDFKKKISLLFDDRVRKQFKNTEIYNLDFEEFFEKVSPGKNDFVFLDPPYDTDFSDYEGREFDHADQLRLSKLLNSMEAKCILIIKNTDYILNLYSNTNLQILSFDKNYTYNVRSRNDRNTEHLVITNIPLLFRGNE